jgi:hypothetical protein
MLAELAQDEKIKRMGYGIYAPIKYEEL